MTDCQYVTQEMWDNAQSALRAALPIIEAHVPPLSTAGTMLSLRDQVRAAIVPRLEVWPQPTIRDQRLKLVTKKKRHISGHAKGDEQPGNGEGDGR